jgi:5-methylcytosine-specific restriction protein A
MGSHDHFYSTAGWLKRRNHQLRTSPWCIMCKTEGRNTLATVADHVEAHGGDYNKFVLGKLQSLCVNCHNRKKQRAETKKQREEAAGYSSDVGVDGWPLDKRHPSYQRRGN